MRKRSAQKGFTIIELVVVILLLGILTATALPRFMDITSEAHDAVVQGVLGGLNTGVALSRATWFAQGRSSGITGLGNNQTIFVNNLGYPTNNPFASPTSESDCSVIYRQLLQEGGRPSITELGGSGTAPPTSAEIQATAYTSDFYSGRSGTACYYVYAGEGAAASSPVLKYDSAAGTVLLEASEI